MTTPLITWSCIVALLLITMIVNVVYSALHSRLRMRHRHHLIETGREDEEFFVPGDRRKIDIHDEEDF